MRSAAGWEKELKRVFATPSSEVPTSWGDTLPIHEIHLQIGEGPVGRTAIIWTVRDVQNLGTILLSIFCLETRRLGRSKYD